MIHLVSLLTAAALVFLQSSCLASAQESQIDLENSLQPNMIPVLPRSRVRKFVMISQPPPETAQVTPGSPLELECRVMGSPAPQVQWLKNGEPVGEYESESNEIIPAEPSSLVSLSSTLIISATSPGSDDVYTCLATAGMKKKTASTTVLTAPGDEVVDELLTLQKLLKLSSRPRIISYYVDLFQNIGTNVILPCQVYSLQKAQVYWQDWNGKLVYGNPRMKVLPSGELVITSLRWADMGEYTCTVKNEMGKDSATTFVYPLLSKEH